MHFSPVGFLMSSADHSETPFAAVTRCKKYLEPYDIPLEWSILDGTENCLTNICTSVALCFLLYRLAGTVKQRGDLGRVARVPNTIRVDNCSRALSRSLVKMLARGPC